MLETHKANLTSRQLLFSPRSIFKNILNKLQMQEIQVISHSCLYCGFIASGGKKKSKTSLGSGKAGLTFVSSVWIRQILQIPLVYHNPWQCSLAWGKTPWLFFCHMSLLISLLRNTLVLIHCGLQLAGIVSCVEAVSMYLWGIKLFSQTHLFCLLFLYKNTLIPQGQTSPTQRLLWK